MEDITEFWKVTAEEAFFTGVEWTCFLSGVWERGQNSALTTEQYYSESIENRAVLFIVHWQHSSIIYSPLTT